MRDEEDDASEEFPEAARQVAVFLRRMFVILSLRSFNLSAFSLSLRSVNLSARSLSRTHTHTLAV